MTLLSSVLYIFLIELIFMTFSVFQFAFPIDQSFSYYIGYIHHLIIYYTFGYSGGYIQKNNK